MNIIINDITLVEQLQSATLIKIEVGSVLYGLQDNGSDKDILHIYAQSINKANSFIYSHHQLQYRDTENKIDLLFVDVQTFIRNLLSGDSTINFEVIHTQVIANSCLSFLYDMRAHFYTYQIIKAYLGFAKRDVKQFFTITDEREQIKRMLHILRGWRFAQSIFNKNFSLIVEDLNKQKNIFKSCSYKQRCDFVNQILDQIEHLRKEDLNKKLEQKMITNFLAIDQQKVLDKHLQTLMCSEMYANKVLAYMDLSLYYQVNENGLMY